MKLYTIGYDFKDTIVQLDNLRFSIRLFTEVNVYAPDPESVEVLNTESKVSLKANKLSWAGNQQKANGSIELNVCREANGSYSIEAIGKHADELCKSVLIQIYDINIKSIEFDQKNIVGFEKNLDIKSRIYPNDIKMPLVFAHDRHDSMWYALSKDKQLRAKAFASHYDPFLQTQVLDLSHEEDKRFRSNEIVMPKWQVGSCNDKRTVILERFKDLEENFGLVPFEERNDTPGWPKDIKLVTILHGEHWTGHVFNTFKQMEESLEWIANKIDGENVLVFLPGWDGRYYYNYPLYEPSKKMGGEKGLKSLVEKAHQLKMKIIPMLGANNANIEILKSLNMEDVSLKDSWGHEKRVEWVDWDYDLFKENNCILANIGNPIYLQHMIQKSKHLLDDYLFDGIFLDLPNRWENDPEYSPYEGLLEWAKELNENYTDILLFGEDSYDVLWGVFSMFHEIWQPGGHEYSLYRYAMQTHYLAYPAPGMGSGGIHEYAWDQNGPMWERDIPELVPTLSIVDGTISNHPQSSETLISKAKSWTPTQFWKI